jgi:hydroxymethylpyrimidine/phosphomethylpyrimidine kinase
MTIAGSDSGGGAGIQADLKTFAALGVYGTTVLTAITAQNTQGVTSIHEVPSKVIRDQFDAVISDIGTDAVKTGMLSSVEIIETVADSLESLSMTNIVIDPVMVAKGGARLLDQDAVETLRNRLLPLARVTTPNAPEAEVLSGFKVRTLQEAKQAATAIAELGAKSVVVKGGHLVGKEAIDIYFDGVNFEELCSPRVSTRNTHGTGCTFASAITAGLALGYPIGEAIYRAKEYVTQAILANLNIGSGHGPLDHFYMMRKK